MRVIETLITDAESLLSAIRLANKEFEGQVWWRGQRDAAWKVIPSVYRPREGYHERATVLRFQQRAVSRHLALPAVLDRAAWLFLMQRFRLPTRLLDWTESPLIAAFFASEIDEAHKRHPDLVPDENGAVFALSPYELNRSQVTERALLMPEDGRVAELIAPAFDYMAAERELVVAVRPPEVDVRLMVQLSVFTINGFNTPLDHLPDSDAFLIKFTIPRDAKTRLLADLKDLGIRLSGIFPDLEHLGQEVAELRFRALGDRAPRTDPTPGRDLPSRPLMDRFERDVEPST